MTSPTLFKGNSLVSSDLFSKLQQMTDNLSGGAGTKSGMARISIKGGKFRRMVNGEQMDISRESSMNIVIVNAAGVSRTYYEGQYNPENPAPPTCWSADTNRPSMDVPAEQRQANNCADCPMNVKGSGQGNSRACRFGQSLAVVLENDYSTVYKLHLSAISVFGSPDGDKMPMQAYARFLRSHNTPPVAVVTEMYFDDNSDVPKLFFKAVRPLDENELEKVLALSESEEAIRAITMTVAQADGIKTKPEKVTVHKAAVTEEEDDTIFEEPKKVTKKTAAKPAPKEDSDLSSIIDEWDD